MTTRIHFLDNLRTVLIFLVVGLHAGMSYQNGFDSFWIVSDPDKMNALALLGMYLDTFVMFIMFFISGYFIRNSINNRSASEYLTTKFKRIMIPWMVAIIGLIPTYKAIYLYSRGLPQQEWYTYFHLFSRAGSDLSLFSNNPTQSWLWFLPILFVFQVTYLLLSRSRLLSIKITLKTAVSLTFVVGVAYAMIISELGLKGWEHNHILDFQRERLLTYFLVFLLGSLCNKLKVFESPVKKRKYYIIANVVLTISLTVFTIVAMNFFYNIIEPNRNYYILSETLDRGMYYAALMLTVLSFMQIFLYVFRFNFNKSNKLMDELNRNSYQVYIIHMVVLGVIASILVHTAVPVLLKYAILTLATWLLSNMIVSAYKRLFYRRELARILALVVVLMGLFSWISSGRSSYDRIETASPEIYVENTRLPSLGLHLAALMGDVQAINQHIKAGSDLNEKDVSGGGSPMGTAATFGQTEVVMALIEAGANVNQTNNEGSTPLHAAAFFGRTEIVKVLLENGADKDIRNNAGSTAYESVAIPFEYVKAIYDQFATELAPLGFTLDYETLQKARPQIADLLQ